MRTTSKFAAGGERPLSRGQIHDESGTLAGLRADREGAAHPHDELARDEEPEPATADAAREGRVEPVELLEDPLLLALRDSESLVAHGEACPAGASGKLDRHLPTVRRILDRVVEQVDEHLPELVFV